MNGQHGVSRRNGSSRSSQNSLEAQFFNPFGTMQLMDSFFGAPVAANGGFSSFSASFNGMNGGGGHHGGMGGNGAVKRTSTSTTFVNGKKLVTKRCVGEKENYGIPIGLPIKEKDDILIGFLRFLISGCLRTERRR